MRVKIGGKIFDSNDEPIMVILDKRDKNLIANMDPDATKYCSFPDHPPWNDKDHEAIMRFMNLQ